MLGICYIETILKEDNNKGESKMTELEASLITILFLIVFLFLTFLFLRIFDRIRDLEEDLVNMTEARDYYQNHYVKIKEFDNELEVHSNIENHILFPRALELQEKVSDDIRNLSFLN